MEETGDGWRPSLKSDETGVIEIEVPESRTRRKNYV